MQNKFDCETKVRYKGRSAKIISYWEAGRIEGYWYEIRFKVGKGLSKEVYNVPERRLSKQEADNDNK